MKFLLTGSIIIVASVTYSVAALLMPFMNGTTLNYSEDI